MKRISLCVVLLAFLPGITKAYLRLRLRGSLFAVCTELSQFRSCSLWR